MADLDLSAIITNPIGEKSFQDVNNLTFKNSSSEDVLAPYYKPYLENEEALYIVVGTDSGLLYEYAKNQSKSAFCKFVFIEFSEVMQALDLGSENSDEQVKVVDENFPFGLLSADYSSYVIRRKIHLIKSLAIMDASPGSAYAKLWDKVEVGFSNYLRSELNSQSAKVFEEQRLINVADNLLPTTTIENKLEGREAIILGGGPTLDDAIDWVKDNQDRLIIFAAARIAKRMEREGILVDFFITVDPFPWSFDNSKSLLTHSEYSILVHSFHAQYRLVSQWTGLSCYLGEKFGWKDSDLPNNFDGPGPTVTNTALHVAVSLGATRVFFSGVDFCFARGKTHESGSVEAEHSDTVAKHSKAVVEDNAGEMTETADDFYSARLAMERAVSLYLNHKDIEFISLGLHSAKMNHVTYKSPDEVSLHSALKADLIDEIKVDLTLTLEERQTLIEQTQKSLIKQQKRFKKILELSNDAVEVADKIYDAKGQVVQRNAKKIGKIQKKVNNLIGKDGDFLTRYQAALFADSFKPLENENAMSSDEVTEQLQAFFGGTKAASEAFYDLIKQGIQRTKLRLQELEPKGSPAKLSEQWAEWKEPGRALIWKEWHGLPDDLSEQKALNESIDGFQHEFEKTDHQYQKMIERNISNVSKILARANNAFAQANVAEIEKIIDHVADMETANEEQKQDFLMLLRGMVLELEGKAVDAFNAYEPISLPTLKHIALKKMLPIALGLEDYEASLIVLERLVQINLDYMVPYADLLSLLNNDSGAIEVFDMYLSQRPNKINAQLKLAQLLIKQGDSSRAQTVLSQVLEQEPDNRTANQIVTELIAS